MLPALVSIRKPACPTLVTCTYCLPCGVCVQPILPGPAGLLRPALAVVGDALVLRVDSVRGEQLRLVCRAEVPRERQRRHRQVGPSVRDTEVAKVDVSAAS